jgi:hypothetical protein
MDSDSLETKFQSCLSLFEDGGGVVNIQFSGEFDDVSAAFASSWILAHHESLSMMTVQLPPHGCFSLLHPSIIMWELDNDDLHPSEVDE